MMRLHSDYVCACLCVFVKQLFTLNSQQENQKKKMQEKSNLHDGKIKVHYLIVTWLDS